MTPDEILRDKLRKIEALFANAATLGEKAAAGAAAERIRQRLGRTAGKEKSSELKFSIPDVWSRQLFIALCRRYGLRPYRHPRMHRQSIMIKAPKSFMEQVLWPEFQELNAALVAYLSEITQKVIREEVHKETGEAEDREPTWKRSKGDNSRPFALFVVVSYVDAEIDIANRNWIAADGLCGPDRGRGQVDTKLRGIRFWKHCIIRSCIE